MTVQQTGTTPTIKLGSPKSEQTGMSVPSDWSLLSLGLWSADVLILTEAKGAPFQPTGNAASIPVRLAFHWPHHSVASSRIDTLTRMWNQRSELEGSVDSCASFDLARQFRPYMGGATGTTSVAWGLKIEQTNQCLGAVTCDPISSSSVIWLTTRDSEPTHRHRLRDSSDTIKIDKLCNETEAARHEIEDLLGAMSRGEPLIRSGEILALCGKLADQLPMSENKDSVVEWAKNLAADLSTLRD